MKASDAFPSKYLGKESVTQPIVATIRQVVMEAIKGENGNEDKAVIYFGGGNIKPLICNRGNWTIIASIYGDDSDGWHGRPIEIYVDPTVMFGKKMVGGLRVRAPQNRPLSANGTGWTYPQAQAECLKAGISKDEMVAELKAKGSPGWNNNRDTPIVQQLIAAKLSIAEQPFDEFGETVPVGDANDEIPF